MLEPFRHFFFPTFIVLGIAISLIAFKLLETVIVMAASEEQKEVTIVPTGQPSSIDTKIFSFVTEDLEIERKEKIATLEEEKKAKELEEARLAYLQGLQFAYYGVKSAEFENQIITTCANLGCDPNQLIRVMYCESTGNSAAENGIYKGLFQHHEIFWHNRTARYGIPGASIWDPYAQIYVSAHMFANGLAYHWECK